MYSKSINTIQQYFSKIAGFFLLLVLIYNTPIYGIQLTKYLYLASFIYIIIYKKKLEKEQIHLIVLGLILVGYGASLSLIRGVGDFNMFNYSRIFTCIFSSVMIVDLLKGHSSWNEYSILKWIGYAGILEASIVLLAFVNQGFHDFLLNFCGGNQRYVDKLSALTIFRGVGWTFAQFSDFALPQGLTFLCFIAYVLKEQSRDSIKKRVYISIIVLMFIITGILIGRTFQFIILIAFIYYCVATCRQYNYKQLRKGLIIFIMTSSIILAIILTFFGKYIPKETLNWAFELFSNMDQSNGFRTDSTDELQTMWKVPETLDSILFGTGHFSPLVENSHPTYSQSDVGFVNSIFYWGILGSILYYLSIFLSFRYCINYTDSRIIRNLSISLFIIIVIYNIKGLGNGFAHSALILQGCIAASNRKTFQKQKCQYVYN